MSKELDDIKDFDKWTIECKGIGGGRLIFTPIIAKWLYEIKANYVVPGIKEIYETYLQQKAKHDEILLQEHNKHVNGMFEEDEVDSEGKVQTCETCKQLGGRNAHTGAKKGSCCFLLETYCKKWGRTVRKSTKACECWEVAE
ncbi:MAG TPA: hypothetical protein HA367_08430 [Candidatus Methanofastidiosum sp.]|nr:hypothetical protein [Methanofastidiosum sp.]